MRSRGWVERSPRGERAGGAGGSARSVCTESSERASLAAGSRAPHDAGEGVAHGVAEGEVVNLVVLDGRVGAEALRDCEFSPRQEMTRKVEMRARLLT